MPVSGFEREMFWQFLVKGALRTTFPEFRQKFLKAIKTFLIRIRTSSEKDIKKYISDATSQPPATLLPTIELLRKTLTFIEENLYLDKPVETSLPLFELMRSIFELFGDFEYKVRVS